MKNKFKKETHQGFSVTTRTYKSYDPIEPYKIGEMERWGILIPTGVTILKQKKYFGWYILFMKKWVGFKKWRRTVPVRDDLIINFMFWYFVKPLNNERPKFSHTRQG